MMIAGDAVAGCAAGAAIVADNANSKIITALHAQA